MNEDEFSQKDKYDLFLCKNLIKRDHHTLFSVKGAVIFRTKEKEKLLDPSRIEVASLISWDHPNILTLSFSSYKRRGVLMGKVSLGKLSWLSWKVLEFCSLEFLELVCWLWDFLCQDRLLISESVVQKFVGIKELLEGTLQHQVIGCILIFISLIQWYIYFP